MHLLEAELTAAEVKKRQGRVGVLLSLQTLRIMHEYVALCYSFVKVGLFRFWFVEDFGGETE